MDKAGPQQSNLGPYLRIKQASSRFARTEKIHAQPKLIHDSVGTQP